MCIGSNKSNAVVSTLLSESRILAQETVAGMVHGDIVKLGDSDNLILSKVCGHWSELAGVSDLVGFIGLCSGGVVVSSIEQWNNCVGSEARVGSCPFLGRFKPRPFAREDELNKQNKEKVPTGSTKSSKIQYQTMWGAQKAR